MYMESVDESGNVKEKISYKSQMLHYGLYDPGEGYFPEIPWHWHEEFEFGYLTGGAIRYKTAREEFILREGDGIFLRLMEEGIPFFSLKLCYKGEHLEQAILNGKRYLSAQKKNESDKCLLKKER